MPEPDKYKSRKNALRPVPVFRGSRLIRGRVGVKLRFAPEPGARCATSSAYSELGQKPLGQYDVDDHKRDEQKPRRHNSIKLLRRA